MLPPIWRLHKKRTTTGLRPIAGSKVFSSDISLYVDVMQHTSLTDGYF